MEVCQASGLSFFLSLPTTDDDGRLVRLRRGEECACGCLSGTVSGKEDDNAGWVDVLSMMKMEHESSAARVPLSVWRKSRLPQHARLVAAGEVIAERRSLTACRLEHAGAA